MLSKLFKFFIKISIMSIMFIACVNAAQADNSTANIKKSTIQKEYKVEPFIPNRADPWVHKSANGDYYFTGSVPEFDRIELRHATTLNGLKTATKKVVWHKNDSGPMSVNIWAPELHYIDGVWYIYFAAGDINKPFSIRMYALSNTSADPMQGEWLEAGKVKVARETFSLDATSFTHKGQRYLVWAQQDDAQSYNSGLVIAKMKNALEVEQPEVYIAEPLLDWERLGYKVNEGAAVLKRNGKIFITYSASATDHRYSMGLLWADENADLMKAESWHKLPKPVFTTQENLFRFGPGHNSFTVSEDGKKDLMVYHARDYLTLRGTPLTDGNRHARIREITWSKEGFPVFNNLLDD